MAGVSITTHVAAPVDAVFAVFTDLEQLAGRVKTIQRIEKLTPGLVGLGTRFREMRVVFKREATEEFEFTAFLPNRNYTLEGDSCGAHYTAAYRFEPTSSGTQVTLDFSWQARSLKARLLAPLGWLMKGTMRKRLQQDLQEMKVAAETAAKQPTRGFGGPISGIEAGF